MFIRNNQNVSNILHVVEMKVYIKMPDVLVQALNWEEDLSLVHVTAAAVFITRCKSRSEKFPSKLSATALAAFATATTATLATAAIAVLFITRCKPDQRGLE